MYMNETIKNQIAVTKNPEKIRALALEGGMTSLWNSCRNLVIAGVTSIQELMTLNVE